MNRDFQIDLMNWLRCGTAVCSWHPRVLFAVAVCLLSVVHIAAQPEFGADVEPILAEHCHQCHGPQRQKSGLRLDARENVFKGGDTGEASVVPGNADGSLLLKRVTASDETIRMPPKGERLSDEQVNVLRRWIDAGAPWPDSANAVGSEAKGELQVTDADREHWAFRRLDPIPVPTLLDSSGATTPVDRFILAALEGPGLTMVPPAGVRTLVRRIYLDLVGLPPSPKEVARWIEKVKDDGRDAAVSALVDELLSSPHYGERWARHWLDLARYADSEGYERDADRSNAYAYRDFVIRALNEDLPFDVFVKWQIAGDELAPERPDALAATGFCSLGPVATFAPTDTELNKRKVRYDVLDDMISTMASAMLGLTVGCARCHDHKYDAIPIRDYYRLTATFLSSQSVEASMSKPHRDLELWKSKTKRDFRFQKIDALAEATEDEKLWLKDPKNPPAESQAAYRKFGKQVEVSDEGWLEWLGKTGRSELARLRDSVSQAEALGRAALPSAIMMGDVGGESVPAYLYGRGDVGAPVESVGFGFLQVLNGGKTPEDYRRQATGNAESVVVSTYQRAALAEWLTDVEQGAGALLARVAMNRLWQHHFGTALVGTPNDIGVRGDEPTHPELLDWLAMEFVRQGWRLKPMHRLIVRSAVYQESAVEDIRDRRAIQIDPENKLWWHRRPIRLEAEVIRDAILEVAGTLDRELLGPPIRVPIPESAMATRSRDEYPVVEESPEQWRRSIYLFVKRSVGTPMMELFDAPDSSASCGARAPTTVPTQALTLLNDSFVRTQAIHFARRVNREAGGEALDRVRRAFELAFARLPNELESRQLIEFLENYKDRDEALVDLCHTLFTLNEFVYFD